MTNVIHMLKVLLLTHHIKFPCRPVLAISLCTIFLQKFTSSFSLHDILQSGVLGIVTRPTVCPPIFQTCGDKTNEPIVKGPSS